LLKLFALVQSLKP